MDESTHPEGDKKAHQKPPHSLVRIACEILVSALTAAALAYLSLYGVGYGAKVAGVGEGCMDGFAILAMMFWIVPPFYVLGCAIGVYVVGRIGNQTGSFLAALGGVFFGVPVTAILYLYIRAADYMMLGIEKKVLWALVFLAPAIGATLCFNLTRRYKKPRSP